MYERSEWTMRIYIQNATLRSSIFPIPFLFPFYFYILHSIYLKQLLSYTIPRILRKHNPPIALKNTIIRPISQPRHRLHLVFSLPAKKYTSASQQLMRITIFSSLLLFLRLFHLSQLRPLRRLLSDSRQHCQQ